MPDELLTIFKICFLVLLYLFFFRVLRAVWTEVTSAPALQVPVEPELRGRRARKAARMSAGALAGGAPAAAAPPAPVPAAPAEPSRLVAREPANLAGIEYALVDDITIGRAGTDIVLEDSFLSGRHASFSFTNRSWTVNDLGSTNGTFVNNVRIDRPTRLGLGDLVQVGNIVFEVR